MQFDVAIIGGGLVGLSLASGLAGSGLSLALVDRTPPPPAEPEPGGWDARVYAISPGSQAFLEQLGAWPAAAERIGPVLQMQVFGDAPGSRIVFEAYDAHVERLASIVEAVWEKRPDILRKVGRDAFHFGAGRAEIDKPILEDRPRHCLQRLIHPPVQFDLVVERAEDPCDCMLHSGYRERNPQTTLIP